MKEKTISVIAWIVAIASLVVSILLIKKYGKY
jgi:hypothetical protein